MTKGEKPHPLVKSQKKAFDGDKVAEWYSDKYGFGEEKSPCSVDAIVESPNPNSRTVWLIEFKFDSAGEPTTSKEGIPYFRFNKPDPKQPLSETNRDYEVWLLRKYYETWFMLVHESFSNVSKPEENYRFILVVNRELNKIKTRTSDRARGKELKMFMPLIGVTVEDAFVVDEDFFDKQIAPALPQPTIGD
ncbi:hypothetical protein PT279_02110 [Bifidobacterium sp. ESL0784]|uniref:hypothetical protein n=1 Tax=Bifidobacterium sp. ESL0784 TaxID=2983231 RepID=UPI0023F8D24E|nr:hypothetical protein [Bifidobacterium sp. ESL0784]MDF7640393.1 hypothetical protein [Bifidobacterium sp. ESL0784]